MYKIQYIIAIHYRIALPFISSRKISKNHLTVATNVFMFCVMEEIKFNSA